MTTVELAVVGLIALVTLFAVIEVGRLFFVVNVLQESTRRGARVAAVCQLNDPRIGQIASFTALGGGIATGLGPEDFVVEYLDSSGNALADPVGSFGLISFVRVRLVNFSFQTFIPLVSTTISMPAFETTLPAESLGVWPGGYSTC